MRWFTNAHPEALGLIPGFLSESDPRPAREQLDAHYQHGGGWQPMDKWVLNKESLSIRYPGGDPPLAPIAISQLRDERIAVYPHAWVLILQKDGSFEVARMD